MYRSYFFALLACAVFSVVALINAYHNLLPWSAVTTPGEKVQEICEADGPENKRARLTQGRDYPNRGSGLQETSNDTSLIKSRDGNLYKVNTSAHSPGQSLNNTGSGSAAYSAGREHGSLQTSGRLSDLTSNPRSKPDSVSPASLSNPEVKGDLALNAQTDNFNILLLGTDGSKLEMVCVYSINHHLTSELKSVSLFFPVNSVIIYKGRKKTLEEIYSDEGWKAVADAVGRKMYIDINHYVKIDRQALRDLENYFEPIYVDGKKVEMETLFVRRTSNEDDRIIARILKQVLRPQIFFRYIPSLVFGIRGDIESNFSFTPSSLAEYYRIAKRLSTRRVEKVVLSGSTAWYNGQKVNIPPEDLLGSAIYKATSSDLALTEALRP